MYNMFIIWVEKDQIYYKFYLNILLSKCQNIMNREKRTEVENKRKKESKKERKHEKANYN